MMYNTLSFRDYTSFFKIERISVRVRVRVRGCGCMGVSRFPADRPDGTAVNRGMEDPPFLGVPTSRDMVGYARGN